jgi:hypothetical protein
MAEPLVPPKSNAAPSQLTVKLVKVFVESSRTNENVGAGEPLITVKSKVLVV